MIPAQPRMQAPVLQGLAAGTTNSGVTAAAGATERAASQRLKGVRLLVVEDNPINQQVAQELLEYEGAIVSVAADGALGVAAVLQAVPRFDLVLMDLQMPIMDGLSASMRIRRYFGPTELPIVALSANASPADRSTCAAAGMNDHVCKPFDLGHLIETMKRHLLRAGMLSGHP